MEPDATVRDAITEVLNNGGLSVVALASAWRIFRLFDRIESPALLVLDINLGPTLDGFKLAIAAQCRWPGLPVMWVASHPVRYTTLTCGPFDWFRMTPFKPDGLMDAARCLIAGGDLHAEEKSAYRDGIDQRRRAGNCNRLATHGAEVMLNGFGDRAEIDRVAKDLEEPHSVRTGPVPRQKLVAR